MAGACIAGFDLYHRDLNLDQTITVDKGCLRQRLLGTAERTKDDRSDRVYS